MSLGSNPNDNTAWDYFRRATVIGLVLFFLSPVLSFDLGPNMLQQHKINTEFDKSRIIASTLKDKQRTLEVEGWHLDTPVSPESNFFITSVVITKDKGEVEYNKINKCQCSWVISSIISSKDVFSGRSETISFRLASRTDEKSIQYRDLSGKSHTLPVYLGEVTNGKNAILSMEITTEVSTIKRAFLAEEVITFIRRDGKPMYKYYTGVVKIVVFKKMLEKE